MTEKSKTPYPPVSQTASLPPTTSFEEPPPPYSSLPPSHQNQNSHNKGRKPVLRSSSSSSSDSSSSSSSSSSSGSSLDLTFSRSVSPEPGLAPYSLQEHVPTRTMSNNGLQKPVAIPATSKKVGSPFLRAYPPSLEEFGLPKEVFIRFLDDLNRVAVANPPLQVLGLAGNIVSFVPLQTAQIVGGSVGAAAAIGSYVISKGRTELHLRKSNKEIFRPRGLKVEIAKADALAKVAGIPILNARGKIDKETALLDPVKKSELTNKITGQQRRLQAFEPWIAHLEMADLPNIDVPSNPLSKWSAAASERQRKKEEKRMLKARAKEYKKGPQRKEKAEDRLERRMDKLEEEAELAENMGESRELRKIERKRRKFERKHEKRVAKSEEAHMKNREEKGTRKILWLIVRNLDAESGEGPDPYTEDVSE